MRFLLRLAMYLAVLGVFAAGATFALPDVARVERNTVIKAEPQAVFATVADLTAQKSWFALAGAAPSVTATVSGPPGPGQTLAWTGGDPALAPGSARVTRIAAPEEFVSTLIIPGYGEGTQTIRVAPSQAGTSVTMIVQLPVRGPLQRWPAYFTFPEKMGAILVNGLDTLRRTAEAG